MKNLKNPFDKFLDISILQLWLKFQTSSTFLAKVFKETVVLSNRGICPSECDFFRKITTFLPRSSKKMADIYFLQLNLTKALCP